MFWRTKDTAAQRNSGRSSRTRHLDTVATEYGHVVLDGAAGRYWHLNDSALIVSRCLREGGSREDAAAALVDTFAIDPALARCDVDAAYRQLEGVGLL
ncbi:lasso peptide biosynthesis PqqD family chaperone [Rhodococcus sp. KRD162]|uniref:lasso peptide biosynthesis PqqD family chaperone n=1 Tax=Rhodococcus sp. KRD162 TaxID=2729725 RepID=UPI0019D12A10|nr:lasso peptide biosynthesis PqqD family chaperone [Rhodococcus sp. KRD162]